MRFGYHAITWGGVIGDATGVTSVKDLNYRSNAPVVDAIKQIASAGYAGLEVFDGNLMDFESDPAVLREALTESGLELVSVYSGANFIYDEILPDELWRINRAAEVASLFGAHGLVVGGGARRASGTTPQDYDKLGAALDQVMMIADDHGLTATYHPHLSTIVESPSDLELIMERTGIGFCPDTAHLAAGGGDPAELIRRFPDRVKHVHLKDFRLEPFEFLPLGEGSLDFESILAALVEAGYDGWMIVELDSFDGDPLTAAQISMRYLDRLQSAI